MLYYKQIRVEDGDDVSHKLSKVSRQHRHQRIEDGANSPIKVFFPKQERGKGSGRVKRKPNWRLLSLLAVLLLVIFSVIAVGCGPGEEAEPPEDPVDPDPTDDPDEPDEDEGPRQGGTVQISIHLDPENLCPLVIPDGTVARVYDVLFNGLVKANPEWEWEPDAAEEWEVSEDARTVTFYMRDDLTFHDGQPLTAHDVKFTLKHMAHPDLGEQLVRVDSIVGAREFHEGEADGVEGLEVIDDYTISITTNEPDASIFSTVSRDIGRIIPKHIWEDVPPAEWSRHDANREPIGSGPFKFVERESDDYIMLEAFEDYHEGRPNIDRLIWRIGDDEAMLGALMNEEIDIHVRVPFDDVDMVENLSFANLYDHDASQTQYIGLNTLHPALGEVKVRQAMATAINIEEITRACTGGYGEPIVAPRLPSCWSYPTECEGWPYDPDRAREMLDEAGWTVNSDTGVREKGDDDMVLDWYHIDRTMEGRLAALVQQNLEDVGIKMDMQSMDFATFADQHLLPQDDDGNPRSLTKDDFHIYLMAIGQGADPQPFERQFHSDYSPPRGHNFPSYSNARVDELFLEMRRTLDLDDRAEVAHELFGILCEEVPWISVFSTPAFTAAHERVQGLDPNVLQVTWNVLDWWVE